MKTTIQRAIGLLKKAEVYVATGVKAEILANDIKLFLAKQSPVPDKPSESIYDIDCNGHMKLQISIKNGILKVLQAMNGYGDAEDIENFTVSQQSEQPEQKEVTEEVVEKYLQSIEKSCTVFVSQTGFKEWRLSKQQLCDLINSTPRKALVLIEGMEISEKLDEVEFETSRERETAYDLIDWAIHRISELNSK